MSNNTIHVTANVYTGDEHYSIVPYEVEFWHQAMAVLFFKYKGKEGPLPEDARSITKIEFTFTHG